MQGTIAAFNRQPIPLGTSRNLFIKDDAARWFAKHYPKIKGATVSAHVEVMATNNHLRKHYPSIKPGSGHDLFYKLGPDKYRLWRRDTDPDPRYKKDFEKNEQIAQRAGLFGIRRIATKLHGLAAGFAGHKVEQRTARAPHDPSDEARPSFGQSRTDATLDLSKSVVLVSCVKSKQSHPAPAQSLYTSAWFRKVRSIVEASGARWFVLSSLYGLVAPDAVVAPYDYTLNSLGVGDRRKWADKVLTKLLPEVANERRIVMFAGQRYREFLIEPLLRHGIKVDVPMAHLTRGEQLAWLSEA